MSAVKRSTEEMVSAGALPAFCAIAADRGSAIAVRDGGVALSYAELADRAAMIAVALGEADVKKGDLVGICLGRSANMMAAVLGVWMAGAAYVPLDPASPVERLEYMREDAGARVILCEDATAALLGAAPGRMEVEEILMTTPSGPVSDSWPQASDVAYVIYTSGSTGRPKGTMVTHGNVTYYATAAREMYGIGPDTVALFHSPLAFDLSVTSTVVPLTAGGSLLVLPDSGELLDQMVEEISSPSDRELLVKLTPTHLGQLGRATIGSRKTTFVVGGETLRYSHVAPFVSEPGTLLFNEYGPTETTVGCSVHLCRPDDDERPAIGVPLGGTRLYVLDDAARPVEDGSAGELFIGGPGVALGYLNRPELTAERFVEDRFAGDGSRMFRSGDRVKCRPDGELEFLGRTDDQIKLRGYRIEPGEVESALREHEGVADAVVMAKGEADAKRLVAYIVQSGASAPTVTGLRSFLGLTLPEYMVPSAFVLVDSFPVTVNGKVDRHALPAPGDERPELSVDFVAPSSAVEQALAGILEEVLEVSPVGIHDNFFELGGDSILGLRVIAKAAKLGLKLTPRDIFDHGTVAGLVEVAAPAVVESAGPIEATGNWNADDAALSRILHQDLGHSTSE